MQEQEDKKLLDNVYQDFLDLCNRMSADNSRTGAETAIALERVQNYADQILAAQDRLSFQRGVEAERKRVDDLFCEWCMENEFVDESEAQNFRKLLTNPNDQK